MIQKFAARQWRKRPLGGFIAADVAGCGIQDAGRSERLMPFSEIVFLVSNL